MMQTKWITYLIVILAFVGCVKPYTPEFNDDSASKIVVQGTVSSNEGYQYVSVSRTSPASDPAFIPINNCEVKIIDDQEQVFSLNQHGDGEYRVWMPGQDLVPGRSYMVRVITPEGQVLESSFDKMPKGPEIGDISYEISPIPTNIPGEFIRGIQFYTDFSADEQDSRYFRWKLTETWEYHVKHPLEYYYDGVIHHIFPPDSSQMVCYNTNPVEDIITLSTTSFSENAIDHYPLNYVQNTSPRLAILYSLLVEQISLSESAYYYWEDLRLNSQQDGELYTSQPIGVKGNMVDINNPKSDVLGYFQASSVSSGRVFVEPIDDFLDYEERCMPEKLRFGLQLLKPKDYPAYLLSDHGELRMELLGAYCVDCRVLGGTTEKPSYWPN